MIRSVTTPDSSDSRKPGGDAPSAGGAESPAASRPAAAPRTPAMPTDVDVEGYVRAVGQLSARQGAQAQVAAHGAGARATSGPNAAALSWLDAPSLLALLHDGGHWLMLAERAPLGPLPKEPMHGASRPIELDPDLEETARAIRLGLHRHGIAIGRVLSAPHHKAREIARLAFGRSETRLALAALNEQDLERTRAELLTPPSSPDRPVNQVVVCDPAVIHAITGHSVRQGDTMVVRLDAAARTLVPVGRVQSDGWEGLADVPARGTNA